MNTMWIFWMTMWIFHIRNIQLMCMLDQASHSHMTRHYWCRWNGQFPRGMLFYLLTIEGNGFQFLGHGCSLVSTTILHIYYDIKHLFCKTLFKLLWVQISIKSCSIFPIVFKPTILVLVINLPMTYK